MRREGVRQLKAALAVLIALLDVLVARPVITRITGHPWPTRIAPPSGRRRRRSPAGHRPDVGG